MSASERDAADYQIVSELAADLGLHGDIHRVITCRRRAGRFDMSGDARVILALLGYELGIERWVRHGSNHR